MKKSLLIAILLLPLAFAKGSSGSQFVPIPDCFPCEGPDGSLRLTAAATRFTPIPDCFPCEGPDGSLRLIAAAARFTPIPDCFPCEGPDGSLRFLNSATTLNVLVRGLRREA